MFDKYTQNSSTHNRGSLTPTIAAELFRESQQTRQEGDIIGGLRGCLHEQRVDVHKQDLPLDLLGICKGLRGDCGQERAEPLGYEHALLGVI